MSQWTPSSWKNCPIKQEAVYEDPVALGKSLAQLECLPPLVTPTEIRQLRESLRDVALGRAFLLQGGDCAELFEYCQQNVIEAKIKLLLQMSLVLIWGTHKPVVRIARMAGQYAKPRSSPMEKHQGQTIHAFRGDIINGHDPAARRPDPDRLVAAYFHSAATLNFVRGALAAGIADLHSPLDWELGHVRDESIKQEYQAIVTSISDSLRFMHTVGADASAQGLETVDLYTSHEALLLDYEQRLTRNVQNSWYNTSAHFLWVGDRTRQLDGAHLEYIRGIENPIGIKVGPSMTAHELVEVLELVNPDRAVGKVTLITRYGVNQIEHLLPAHISAVKKSGHVVVWQCDPMHGNTLSTASGIKTRRFDDVLGEVRQALAIHRSSKSFLGGVHLELTGEAVTECLGGSEGLTETHLDLNYATYCDPRLNEKQALELAFLLAGHHRADPEVKHTKIATESLPHIRSLAEREAGVGAGIPPHGSS